MFCAKLPWTNPAAEPLEDLDNITRVGRMIGVPYSELWLHPDSLATMLACLRVDEPGVQLLLRKRGLSLVVSADVAPHLAQIRTAENCIRRNIYPMKVT